MLSNIVPVQLYIIAVITKPRIAPIREEFAFLRLLVQNTKTKTKPINGMRKLINKYPIWILLSLLVSSFCGLPQLGQTGALLEICLPHSLQ